MSDTKESDSKPSIEIQKSAENSSGAHSTMKGGTGDWSPKGMCWTPHIKIDPTGTLGYNKA